MRILSASIRNYRIHKDLSLDFDPQCNLIGGTNETGKSTLIEAVHRAFFLKASTGGALQKSMVSDRHPGHPEVDVTFETKGKTYKISKRFSGTNGTANLSIEGEEVLKGAEAEEKLANLLGIEDTGGARMTPALLKGRWGHLWVWQGSSGTDPSGFATQEKDSLLTRLKDQGGGAVMQSDLDGRVTGIINGLFSENFTDKGKVRAGSPLFEAEKNREFANEKQEAARFTLEQLSEAMSTSESTARTIIECEEQAVQISDQRKAAEKIISEADQLAQRLKVDRPAFEQNEKDYQSLFEADSAIEELGKKIAVCEDESKEQSAEGEKLESAAKSFRKQFAEANKETRSLDESVRDTGNRHELASAWFKLKELAERQDLLKKKVSEIAKLESKREVAELDLAKLPEINSPVLEELQNLSFAVAEAKTALKAMATEITVIESSETVRVGENKLATGKSTVIAEDSEIQIGDDIRLRIAPGGGSGLEDARSHETECIRDFQERLDRLGIASLDEARAQFAARQKLEMAIQLIQSELTGIDSEAVDKDNRQTANDLERSRFDVERCSKLVSDEWAEPKDAAKARLIIAETLKHFRQTENDAETAKEKRDSLEENAEEAEEDFAEHRKDFEGEKQKLNELKTRFQVLVETSGKDEDRGEKLKLLEKARDEAKEKLKATECNLAEMQPEKHRNDLERFTRASDELERRLGQAKEEKAVAREKLRSDGTQDLNESLRQAEAAFDFAKDQFAVIDRKAKATKLLKEMFAEEQRALADQFTGPLVDSISEYLKCIFGSDVSAAVNLDEGEFKGLKLIRSGETFDFDSLSGGTREQVSAAVRLAMAEILLDENDGSLPLVFDDAFANSDQDRIQSLQRMLDMGARNGLQIILLSCDPSRYVALGAKTRILS